VFYEAEITVWRKFGMPDNQEGKINFVMQTRESPVDQIAENRVVLVLPDTIVGRQKCVSLTQAMVCKKMIQQRDNSVGILMKKIRLVNEIVDLARDPLTTDAEQLRPSRSLEIYRAHLLVLIGVGKLLRKIPRIMHCNSSGIGSAWRNSLTGAQFCIAPLCEPDAIAIGRIPQK